MSNSDLKDAERTSQSFAMVFEENVLRSIDELDNMLFYLRRNIEARKATTDYNTILHTTDIPSDILVQVSIIDAQGIMRASTAGPQPAPPMDLSDREHFKAQLDSNEDRLFISKPLIGRVSGKWSVQLSRRFFNADGTFGGVVVASLDPEHFTRFYNKVDLASSGSISLIGDDGVVRSAGGQSGNLRMGQDIRGTELFDRMQAGFNSDFEEPDMLDRTNTADRAAQGQRSAALGERQSRQERGAWPAHRPICAMDCIARRIADPGHSRGDGTDIPDRGRGTAKSKELELALETMARLASEDSLTGLLNRRGFRSALAEIEGQHAAVKRTTDQVEYAVLFLDLDRFKIINDTLGHRIGDLLLQETAQRLRAALRSTDCIGAARRRRVRRHCALRQNALRAR